MANRGNGSGAGFRVPVGVGDFCKVCPHPCLLRVSTPVKAARSFRAHAASGFESRYTRRAVS